MTEKVPQSKATTAYELLDEIAALALDEPKRIHMNFWHLSADHAHDARCLLHGFPACGTVGCIGGWVELLTKSEDATKTLGLKPSQSGELFYNDDLLEDAGDAYRGGNAQTAAHAANVVAHIRKFQDQHEAQLKATRLP